MEQTAATEIQIAQTQPTGIPFNPQPAYIDRKALTKLWQRVEKPGRYTGGEYGIPEKDLENSQVRVALSYPDTYELGMSNQGLKILYDFTNRVEGFIADRTFLPWPDFGDELVAADLPLYSLDHYQEIRTFDIWGFNTAHELHHTNLLYGLELARIPLLRRERGPHDPFIITGGTAVSNPLPLMDFMDGVFMGDGEEALVEIMEIIRSGKEGGKSRAAILEDMRVVEGLFLPEFYEIEDQGLEKFPVYTGEMVKKRNYRAKLFADLTTTPVPNIEITQDRVVVEVNRGCGQGCRFCHAGFWKRPVRNSEVDSLVAAAGKMLDQTGSDSISLHSLSIADYPWLEELVVAMAQAYGPRGVSLSVPSLRVQVKTIPVIQMTQNIRRSSVTFALEAGSELMRERIRKKSSEENLHFLIREIYSRGWDLVKVYFMLGLPDRENTEVDDVLRALNALGALAEAAGPKCNVNVTVSLFVPKPFTTFQWEEQKPPKYFLDAIHKIKDGMTSKRVHLKYPNPWQAYVEGMLSRSDHRVGEIILKAYNKGAIFDSWDDRFDKRAWQEILDEVPAELKTLWLEQCPGGIPKPWHQVIDGISSEKLYKDFEKFEAVTEENMNPPHRQALTESDYPEELLKPVEIPPEKFECNKVLEIAFAKSGNFIYVSHLDSVEALRRAGRRARLPMTFSQGFNKHEKFSMTDSLPLFFHSTSERVYVELYQDINVDEFLKKFQELSPDGLDVHTLIVHDKVKARYSPAYRYQLDFNSAAEAEAVHEKLVNAPATFKYEKQERKKKKLRALKRGQSKFKMVEKALNSALSEFELEGARLTFTIVSPDQGALSISKLLTNYLEFPTDVWNTELKITRVVLDELPGDSLGIS